MIITWMSSGWIAQTCYNSSAPQISTVVMYDQRQGLMKEIRPKDQILTLKAWQGPRERVPPQTQITTSTLPLGEMVNQRTGQVQCGPLI
jgi:hypothetical protein